MKVTIEKTPLLNVLTHLQRIVEKRNTYPILANILVRAEGDRLFLRATDLDIEVSDSVPATVHADGVTTIPAHTLHNIVKKLGNGSEITLDVADHQLKITSGRSKFDLQCLDAEGFPEIRPASFIVSFDIDAADLAYLISKTQFAISNEETRYYLNGIYLHATDSGLLRAVATDGHRLARAEIEMPPGAAEMPGTIIPRKTVTEVLKIVSGHKGAVRVDVSDTKIQFTIGGIVLTSKAIEGSFPDYERVTPKENNKIVLAEKAGLSAVLDRVGTLASERGGKAVKLSFTPGEVTLSVSSPDHGSAEEPMDVESDIDLEIGFNARYLGELMGVLDGEKARFQFNDAGSPTLIRDESDPRFLAVLMPMRC